MKRWGLGIAVALIVFAAIPVRAQQTAPDAVAAARQLLVTMRATDQFKAILPLLFQQLKPAIAQGRAEVAAEFDRIVPLMLARFNSRIDQFIELTAELYAAHFTAAELREVIKFYEGETGKKFLQKLPELTRQSLAIGNRFGQEIAREVQKEMIEELRNRGHKL